MQNDVKHQSKVVREKGSKNQMRIFKLQTGPFIGGYSLIRSQVVYVVMSSDTTIIMKVVQMKLLSCCRCASKTSWVSQSPSSESHLSVQLVSIIISDSSCEDQRPGMK